MRSNKYGLGLAITAACMAFGTSAASAATEKVLENSTGWSAADTRPGGTALFRTGPALAPMGGGSLTLSTINDNAAKVQRLTSRFGGVRLDAIDGLGYSTYRSSTSVGAALETVPAINLRVDLKGDGTEIRNLVYEPYLDRPGVVKNDSWQSWDAYRAGEAKWWITPSGGGIDPDSNPGTSNNTCYDSYAEVCSIDEILSYRPDAKIVAAGNNFGVNLGSYNPGITASVDGLYLAVNGAQTTFDFEAEAGPTGPAGQNGTNGTNGTNGSNGTNGAQGTSGVTPSSTTITGKVSLISKSLKVSKKSRKVSVSVSCPRTNGLCEGRLNLIRKGKTIARTNFVVRGGRSSNVSVTLSKKAYKALKKSQSVKVDVFSRDLAGNASAATKSLTLKK